MRAGGVVLAVGVAVTVAALAACGGAADAGAGVGAGAGGDSSMDAGNMLKPMLARGELRMVGATTLDEY
ncbi:hypothetical protein ACFWAP_32405, partial [Streptomyces goshikiensis]|uniref:hypothetical protein n=1 Tax=Streptomyces goshikiensis TaxID=1942 RepID=UPI00364ACCC1